MDVRDGEPRCRVCGDLLLPDDDELCLWCRHGLDEEMLEVHEAMRDIAGDDERWDER